MEDRAEIEAFRLRYRVSLLERLVLKTAYAAPVLAGRLSAEESRQALVGWLSATSKATDRAYGEVFQDPALTALYSDEAKGVTEKLIAIVESLHNESRDVL